MTAAPTAAEPRRTYPGARRPDRQGFVDSYGLRLATYEWGDPAAPPILLAHGGFDFAGTFDVLAPRLADAGWRAVAWDQRGHGDSDYGVLYSWEADIRDAVAVLDSLGDGPERPLEREAKPERPLEREAKPERPLEREAKPLPVVGHSKGGALMLQLAETWPQRVSHLVNLDGLPSASSWPDVPEHNRTRMLTGELGAWLDHRRSAGSKARRPDTIEGLARRRHRMNPRLPIEWLEYLVTVGARQDPDGWRWKIDPALRLGGFGPWRPEWSMWRLPGLPMPVMAVLGLVVENMGWGTRPEDVAPYLPPGGRFIPLDDTGHFVHIEKPQVIADLVLDFVS